MKLLRDIFDWLYRKVHRIPPGVIYVEGVYTEEEMREILDKIKDVLEEWKLKGKT